MPIKVIDTIKPNGIPLGQTQFPTVEDIDILGGFQVQPNASGRLAIPQANQKVGMLVYQLDNSTYYNLTVIGSPGTWAVATFSGGGGFTAGGDLSGTSSAQIVSKIQGVVISGTPSINQVLTATGSTAASWQNAASGFTAGGDLNGTSSSQIVVKIQGNPVQSGTNSITQDGYVITWVNSASQYQVKPAATSFTAAGDLSGTFSSQTVIKINGATVPSAGALSVGTILQVSGSSALTYSLLTDSNVSVSAAISGTKISPNFGSQNTITTGSATATSIRISGIIAVGAILTDISGNLSRGTINLASATYVSGILPTANQANQTMGGDVTGATNLTTVIKLQGNAVLSQSLTSAQDGYALTWVNGSSQWQAKPQAGGGFIAGGDLSGTSSSQVVIQIQGHPIATQTLGAGQDGYVLTWSFSDGYYHAAISTGGGGGSPTGSAGGNLTGTYPNPLVITTTPIYLANLLTLSPNGTRCMVMLDGYRASGDGGEGNFLWRTGTFVSDGGTIMVPSGFAGIGAWFREENLTSNFYNALWFGAIPDGVTDNITTLQHIADLCTASNSKALYLGPSTFYPPQTDQTGGLVSFYAISSPLVKNDIYTGNNLGELYGGGSIKSGLIPTTQNNTYGSPDPSWIGPLIVDGQLSDSLNTYVSRTYSSTPVRCLLIGDGYASLNFSEYDTGDLDGATGFSFEMFIAPLVYASPGENVYFSTQSGNVAGISDIYAATFVLGLDSTGHIFCSLAATSGTRSLNSNTAGLTLPLNTLSNICVDWDGTTLRLFVNGVSGTGMSGGLTGTITNYWWSEFILGYNLYGVWPSSNGSTFQTGKYYLGPVWLSIASRHAANYTPSLSLGPCDTFTKILINFDNVGVNPSRTSISNFVIGRTGATIAHGGIGRSNLLVYLDTHTTNTPYTIGSNIHDLTLVHNVGGKGVMYIAALFSNTHHMNIYCNQGLNYLYYCYGNEISGDISFRGATSNPNCWNWNMLFHNGTQFTHVGPRIQSNSALNWHAVCTYNSIRFDECFIGNALQGYFFLGANTDVAQLNNCTIDDEGGTMKATAIYFNGNGLLMNGGWINNNGNGKPGIMMNSCENADISTTIYTNPIFSFTPIAQSRNIPIKWSGVNGYGATLADAYHTGPIIIPAKESFGTHIVSFIANADLALNENDIFYRMVQVNDGYGITATRKVNVLYQIAGYQRTIFNNTSQSIIWGYPGGTAITIAAGKTAQVLSVRDSVRTITNAVNSSGLIKITATAHGYTTGDYILIQNVFGTIEANSSWFITVIDVNNFTLNGSVFTNTYIVNSGVAYKHYWRRTTADI